MIRNLQTASSDLRGLARLAVTGTVGVTDLVEAVHDGIRHPLSAPAARAPKGLQGLIYGAVRLLTRTAGLCAEAALSPFGPQPNPEVPSPRREALLAALNGAVGDHLAATGNPLALPMTLHHAGQRLVLETGALARAVPRPGTRIVLLVHGLCRNDRQWHQGGRDHGAALARDLGCTALYLRYNSGLHISANGKTLAELLETLVTQWPEPVESLSILAHSMGGLLARSACHQAQEAGRAWPARLRHLIFLGTPHHGSPLEQWGHWLERGLEAAPFARPLARLGKARSAGITDLRFGNLLEEDWLGSDDASLSGDRRRHVPLPEGVLCCALAAQTGTTADSVQGRLLGDGLVPVDSALGRHRDPRRCLRFPADRTWIGQGMGHLDLVARPEAYEQIRRWMTAAEPGAPAGAQG